MEPPKITGLSVRVKIPPAVYKLIAGFSRDNNSFVARTIRRLLLSTFPERLETHTMIVLSIENDIFNDKDLRKQWLAEFSQYLNEKKEL